MSLSLLADAGTPLVWAGLFHLTFGNLFIGVLEAIVIRLIFKIKGGKLFAWIIAGNYASSIAGAVFLNLYSEQIVQFVGGSLPIYRLSQIFTVLAAVTFVLTIVIEWPFYWLGMRSRKCGWGKSFLANLIGNAASYWLLVGLYFGSALTPSTWGLQLCPADQLTADPRTRILFLSPDGTKVMQLRVGEREPTLLLSLAQPAPNGGLGLVQEAVPGRWQLTVKTDVEDKTPAQAVAEISASRASTRPSYSDGSFADDWDWYSGRRLADLEDSSSPRWTVDMAPYAFGQIAIRDNKTGVERVISLLEIPMTQWYPCHPTVLPHDQLVFAFGEQIMIADLDRNLVAAVAPGHSPVVVIDNSPTSEPAK